MLKKVRKSSAHITLVLIGAVTMGATLGACGNEETRRDVYASKEDCLADWGNTPTDCAPAYDRPTGNANTTHYYGRPYRHSGGSTSSSRSSKTIGSSTVSRGGFGGSGHSASG